MREAIAVILLGDEARRALTLAAERSSLHFLSGTAQVKLPASSVLPVPL